MGHFYFFIACAIMRIINMSFSRVISWLVGGAAALALIGVGCARTSTPVGNTPVSQTPQPPPAAAPELSPLAFPGVLPEAERLHKQVRMRTTKGEIVFELFGDEAPKTVSNFVYLTNLTFYNGLTFHRVVPGFVIQGGDPLGNGTGGPGYQFEDEPVTRDYAAGIVAMANAGPNTNGSQFFIVLEDQPGLPKNYNVFGRVISGMDVVQKIQVGDRMIEVRVEEKR